MRRRRRSRRGCAGVLELLRARHRRRRSVPRRAAARPGRRRARRRRSRSRRRRSPPAPASPRVRLRRRSRSRTRAASPARSAAPPGTLTAHASCTTAWSANVPQRSTGVSSAPSHGPVHPPLRAELRGAAARIAAPALRALAARRPPRDDDAVAGRDHGHVAAHLLDDPGALVAEQDREPRAPALRLDDVEVGVAEPAGQDADEHLARAGRVDRQLLDGRRRVGLGVDDAARHVASAAAARRAARAGA